MCSGESRRDERARRHRSSCGDGEPPRRGRPRGPEPRSPVTAHFGATEHDRIIAEARDRGLTVAEFVRAAVRRALTGRRHP
jgi:hypothetical protein